ncbi:scavenger receptor cysteine-rich type 1 protein M130-like [Micropterus dolomieu]|uniref:scavenger receptor cysteine-rich type 1 protein M130-like n=1 Tax=Micropterus dolomieu TaxID=147949 RepID=UPI001E8E9CA9|nr:scavenger receptor cysteine-rich type 1 protein M130-like [Micropterus dolomieu]
MDHLVLLLLLWSSGLQAEGQHTSTEPDDVKLVGGASRCAGMLELKHQGDWRPVRYYYWNLKAAAVVCRELDCGSAVSVGEREESSDRPVWWIRSVCVQSGSALRECVTSYYSSSILDLTCSDSVRLVDGTSLCSGRLEVKSNQSNQSNQRWSSVCEADFDQQDAEVVCRELGCGAPSGLQGALYGEVEAPMWTKEFQCGGHESALLDCRSSGSARNTCSPGKAVGLTLDGTSLCSGRLEVKSNQRWSSVCEADFDQQDAEVVCRELGCGAPSVLQGALYGEVEAPMWTKEFQCGGHESALLDCRSSGSARNTCSPGKAVGLTCSEPVRLVGGASRCAGTLEVKQGDWRPVRESFWTLKTATVVCRDLDCGSAVSVGERKESSDRPVWWIRSDCVQSGSALRECVTSTSSSFILDLTCSDSVRLVNGTSLCSGRLEVKSNQRWSSVCEADFDQQDAEVVCRELGCGAPSVLQGALYGEVEAPMWTKEFQCGGHESALLDCRSSGSARNTCSPGKAVGLTCSEPVRLVGGASRCAGTLELKHQGDWRPVRYIDWTLKEAAVVCRQLDCGSAVSVGGRKESSRRPTWWIRSECVQSGSALMECATSSLYLSILYLTCSDSVRLLDGTRLCSGRLEVKSNQRWSSVCEADFDQQDAEVVCRELGCGAPSFLQRALYGEVEAPMWTKEFQCGGHESALLDCRSSGSARNTCSPGKAVGLTCSEPDDVRLVGGASRCAGTLELKHQGDWRPVSYFDSDWTLKTAGVFCRDLDCGSAVSVGKRKESSDRPVWSINSDCVQSGSALRECSESFSFSSILDLTCTDLLLQPNISASSSVDGVSEAQQQGFQVSRGSTLNISCSIQPQYPGGSFQLTFTSSNASQMYTQRAVNHSAHFLFLAAEPAHQGNYSCVYHVHVFSHDFSSESRRLSLTVSDSTVLLINVIVLPLTLLLVLVMVLLLVTAALYFYYKVRRSQENIVLKRYTQCVSAAEGGPTEEEEAQRAE